MSATAGSFTTPVGTTDWHVHLIFFKFNYIIVVVVVDQQFAYKTVREDTLEVFQQGSIDKRVYVDHHLHETEDLLPRHTCGGWQGVVAA